MGLSSRCWLVFVRASDFPKLLHHRDSRQIPTSSSLSNTTKLIFSAQWIFNIKSLFARRLFADVPRISLPEHCEAVNKLALTQFYQSPSAFKSSLSFKPIKHKKKWKTLNWYEYELIVKPITIRLANAPSQMEILSIRRAAYWISTNDLSHK